MRRVLLGAVCALAVGAAAPASAQIWGASADGDYFNTSGIPGYDANLAVNIPLNWDQLSLQMDVGTHAFDSAHDKNFGGALIWNDASGEFRLAAVANYNHDVLGPLRLNETPIGAGAEWYPTDWLTLGARGGGIVGSGYGEYAGAALKVYPLEDFSIAGTIDYTGLTYHSLPVHETDYGANAEWLVSETFPMAITSSYIHSHFDGAGAGSATANTVSVGLKFYVNEFGAGALAPRDRTGTLDTIGTTHPILLGN
jgi:hypothetical protein